MNVSLSQMSLNWTHSIHFELSFHEDKRASNVICPECATTMGSKKGNWRKIPERVNIPVFISCPKTHLVLKYQWDKKFLRTSKAGEHFAKTEQCTSLQNTNLATKCVFVQESEEISRCLGIWVCRRSFSTFYHQSFLLFHFHVGSWAAPFKTANSSSTWISFRPKEWILVKGRNLTCHLPFQIWCIFETF